MIWCHCDAYFGVCAQPYARTLEEAMALRPDVFPNGYRRVRSVDQKIIDSYQTLYQMFERLQIELCDHKIDSAKTIAQIQTDHSKALAQMRAEHSKAIKLSAAPKTRPSANLPPTSTPTAMPKSCPLSNKPS